MSGRLWWVDSIESIIWDLGLKELWTKLTSYILGWRNMVFVSLSTRVRCGRWTIQVVMEHFWVINCGVSVIFTLPCQLTFPHYLFQEAAFSDKLYSVSLKCSFHLSLQEFYYVGSLLGFFSTDWYISFKISFSNCLSLNFLFESKEESSQHNNYATLLQNNRVSWRPTA